MKRQLVAVGSILAIAAGSVGFYLAQTATVTPSITVAPGAPATGRFSTMVPIAATVTGLTGLGAAVSGGFPLARFTTSYANVQTLKVTVFWLNPNSSRDYLKLGYLSVGAYQVVHPGSCVTAPKETATAPDVTLTTHGTYCAVQVGASGPELTSSGKLILSRTILGGYLVASGATGTATIPSCSTRSTAAPYATDQSTKSPCRPASITNPDTAAVYICAVVMNHGGNAAGQTTKVLAPLQFTMIGSKE